MTVFDFFFFLENPERLEKELKKMAASTVGDICNRKMKTVAQDTPLDEIATIMAEKNVHTLPVMDGDKLVGVIGKTDIIKTLIR
jgi:CBS-domain-containing membrane protein